MHRASTVVTAVTAAVLVLAAGCASDSRRSGTTSANPAGSGTAAAVSGTVTVFAAASLKEAFTTLAKQFEGTHPGVSVKLDFDASSALAAQINQGAPADVFASAAPKNMQQVVSAAGATAPVDFASNVMEIAVPPGNPAKITGVADLARRGVKVALCQSQVPCGSVATQVFAKAKIAVKPVTLEPDVKSTLSKVELNEVDAGMVYVTDVRAAGDKVTGILIPGAVNASTEYPIAALTKAPNAVGARAFVAFVLSEAGRSVLTADGFEQP